LALAHLLTRGGTPAVMPCSCPSYSMKITDADASLPSTSRLFPILVPAHWTDRYSCSSCSRCSSHVVRGLNGRPWSSAGLLPV